MRNPFKFVKILPLAVVIAVVFGVGFFYHFHRQKRENFMRDKAFRAIINFEKTLNNKISYTKELIASNTFYLKKTQLFDEAIREHDIITNRNSGFLSHSADFLFKYQFEFNDDFSNKVDSLNDLLDSLIIVEYMEEREECYKKIFPFYNYSINEIKRFNSANQRGECYNFIHLYDQIIKEYVTGFENIGKIIENLNSYYQSPPGLEYDSLLFPKKEFTKLLNSHVTGHKIEREPFIIKSGNSSKIHFLVDTSSVLSGGKQQMRTRTLSASLIDYVGDIIELEYFDNVILFDSSDIYHNYNEAYKIYKPDTVINKLLAGNVNKTITDFYYSGIPHYLFVIPLENFGQEIYLGGVISVANYNGKVMQVDPNFLTLLFLIMGTILIFFPVWKLVFMNEYDEMDKSDVYMIALSIVAGTYFIITVIFSVYSHYYYNKVNIKNNLTRLSGSINDELEHVFKNSKEHLQKLNSKLDRVQSESVSLYQPRNNKALYDDEIKNHPVENAYSKCFELSIFLDSLGQIKYINGETATDISTNITVNSRKYFSNARDKNQHFFSLDDEGRKYYFQSIYSYTSNNNEFAISTPAQTENSEIKVIALTHNIQSLLDPILPNGYGYSVIDKEGQVLLHSNPRKILRENFILECESDSYLIDIMKNNEKDFEKVYYNGKEHLLYVTTIENTPFFLVSMYNLHIHQMMNTHIYLYIFTFIFANLLLMALLICITLLVFKKKTNHLNVTFTHAWLIFHPTYNKRYLYLNVSFGIIILLYFFILFFTNNLLMALCVSWVILIGANMANFTVLNRISWDNLKEIRSNTKEQNFLRILGKKRILLFYVLNFLLFFIVCFIFLRNSGNAITQMGDKVLFWLIIALVITILGVYFFKRSLVDASLKKKGDSGSTPDPGKQTKRNGLNRINNYLKELSFKPEYTYIIFLFFWICLIGVIPSMHIYKVVYNKEYDLWKINEVTKASNLIESKIINKAEKLKAKFGLSDNEALKRVFDNRSEKKDSLSIRLNTANGYYLNCLTENDSIDMRFIKQEMGSTDCSKDSTAVIQYNSVSLINQIYKQVRVKIKGFKEANYTLLNFSLTGDVNSPHMELRRDLALWHPMENSSINAVFNRSNFLSMKGDYNFLPEDLTFLIWLFVATLIFLWIYLVFTLLSFVLRNITYFKFEPLSLVDSSDSIFEPKTENKPDMPDRIFKPVYVFDSVIRENITEKDLNDLINKPESRYYKIIHCTNIDKISYDDKKLTLSGKREIHSNIRRVLITNLDYDIGNSKVFKDRLKLLEWLYQHKKIHVTITTSYGVDRFEEIYHDLLKLNQKNLDESMELESSWYKWIFLFRKFKRSILPLKMISHGKGKVLWRNKSREQVGDFDDEVKINEEMNKLSFTYRSIYNDLDDKERILVLDLAKDGIINIHNKYALRSLLRKGLLEVRRTDTEGSIQDNPILRIKRNSFKQFLLQLSEKGETRDIADTIKKKGRWSSMKYLLLIVMIGLIVFLGFIEQSIFDRFLALFGAAAVVIPMIFKLTQGLFVKQETGV